MILRELPNRDELVGTRSGTNVQAECAHMVCQYIIMGEKMYIIMEWDDEEGIHYNGTDQSDQGGRKAVHYNEGNDIHYNGMGRRGRSTL